jgi:saccharopine dehydrogenase (NAD+, L-glutamate forming)
MADNRDLDLVVFGATGFTGGLTARYLAEHAPAGFRWAIAGRNKAKLEAVRDTLAAEHPGCADLPLLHADVDDPDSLRTVASAARVVATTVGPYTRYGEPLVAGCAAEGTHYLDLTAEPEFIDLTYLRHHETATKTGARLVHCCGFDSVPADLGALFTVQQLPEGVPLTVKAFVRSRAGFSAGTIHSALTILGRRRETARAARQRREVEPRPSGRRIGRVKQRLHHEPAIGKWGLPLPTIDPVVVRRSAAALDRYGPDFRYGHYLGLPLPVALGLLGGGAVFLTAMQVPALRSRMMRRFESGQGPSEELRQKSWFKVEYVGVGGGQRVVTSLSGGDPGYTETSKILAEAAMSLALDSDLPEVSGQLTPAVAMGDALIRRLDSAGLRFSVVKSEPAG